MLWRAGTLFVRTVEAISTYIAKELIQLGGEPWCGNDVLCLCAVSDYSTLTSFHICCCSIRYSSLSARLAPVRFCPPTPIPSILLLLLLLLLSRMPTPEGGGVGCPFGPSEPPWTFERRPVNRGALLPLLLPPLLP